MTLVEPCCGTAALTLHLLGARRQIVPRQGSKWRWRRELADQVGSVPSRVILSDASPWALVVRELLAGDRRTVMAHLRCLVSHGERDPRHCYASLHGQPVPSDVARMSAELLWLQRMAFAGKCVRVVDGRWSAPGLSLTSALGVAATDKFGEVRPLGRSLLEAVAALPRFPDVEANVGLAQPRAIPGWVVVYLDPPYAGTTGYGPTLTRDEVVDLARRWAATGAAVLISESEAVHELGWPARQLGRVGEQRPTQLFKAAHRGEWLTSSPQGPA